jgi:23S rRNA-/tRNA-specific pseudouridylate synthase
MPLRHEARDTLGQGAKLTDLLIELELVPESEITSYIRRGSISVNKQVIKDVLFTLNKGSHIIAFNNETQIRITVI